MSSNPRPGVFEQIISFYVALQSLRPRTGDIRFTCRNNVNLMIGISLCVHELLTSITKLSTWLFGKKLPNRYISFEGGKIHHVCMFQSIKKAFVCQVLWQKTFSQYLNPSQEIGKRTSDTVLYSSTLCYFLLYIHTSKFEIVRCFYTPSCRVLRILCKR